VKGALQQLETALESAVGTDDQTAAEVALTPSGNLTSTSVQSGLQELQIEIDGNNSDITALQNTQSAGLIGYTDKATMDADAGNPADKIIARIADDATASNNGYYLHDSTGGSWTKQADLYDNTLEVDNEAEAVTGKAVADWVIDTAIAVNLEYLGVPAGSDLVAYYSIDTVLGQFVNSSGDFTDLAGFQRTGYVPIPNGIPYIRYVGNWDNPGIRLAFYDVDRNFISAHSEGSTVTEVDSIAVPANAKFLAASGDPATQIQIFTYDFGTTVLDDIASLELTQTEFDSLKAVAIYESDIESLGFAVGTDIVQELQADSLDGYVGVSGIVASTSYHRRKVVLPAGLRSLTYVGNWNSPSLVKAAFFDISGTRIETVERGAAADTTINIIVPDGAYTFQASGLDGTRIKLFTESFSTNINTDQQAIRGDLDTITINVRGSIPVESVDLIDYYEVQMVSGEFINSLGNAATLASFSRTDYVPVIVKDSINLTYTGNWSNPSIYLAYYDIDTTLLGTIARQAGVTTNRSISITDPDTRYIRASTDGASTDIQLILEKPIKLTSVSPTHEILSLKTQVAAKAEQSDVNDIASDLAGALTEIDSLNEWVDTLHVWETINIEYADKFSKLSNFAQNFLEKDDDCVIGFQGTSITQGGDADYTTEKSNPETYPLWCDENDLVGLLYDYLSPRWPGQQARRYDSGYFTETGTWATISTDTTWDDAPKRISARSSASTGNVSFSIPDSTMRFDFLYKTEKKGGTCNVVVAGGNGLVEVYNGIAWVEANGYNFSTVQAHDTVPRAGDPFGDLSDGFGNTIHGKRLKMRCYDPSGSGINSLSNSKTLTIGVPTPPARLSYWGVEWSPRLNMLIMVNAGRGSATYRIDDTPPSANYIYSSPFFIQTDLMFAEPDLLIVEVSHNGFAANDPTQRIEYIEDWYFNALDTNRLSIDSLISDTTDLLFWNPPGGVDYSDGLPLGTYWNGQYWTVHDTRDYDRSWFAINKSGIAFADCHAAMREASVNFYGNYQNGLRVTSITGWSLMRDKLHPNENGYKTMFQYLKPWFKY
jgi:hypothetical protein